DVGASVVDLPSLLVDASRGEVGTARRGRGEVVNVPREVTNLVRARDPRRHRHRQAPPGRRGDPYFDVEILRVRFGDRDVVAHRWRCGGSNLRRGGAGTQTKGRSRGPPDPRPVGPGRTSSRRASACHSAVRRLRTNCSIGLASSAAGASRRMPLTSGNDVPQTSHEVCGTAKQPADWAPNAKSPRAINPAAPSANTPHVRPRSSPSKPTTPAPNASTDHASGRGISAWRMRDGVVLPAD